MTAWGSSPGLDRDALARGYARAAADTARHGRTYHLGARLLPPARRQGVFALYGFARLVDDLVDEPADPDPTAIVAAVDDAERQFRRALRTVQGSDTAPSDVYPVDERILAVADTAYRFGIDEAYFSAFLTSMRMDVPGSDLERTRYTTMTELDEYMYGSASVIGLQLLPIIGTADDANAAPHAAALGEAFQLTNFLRDVGEDLDRGRIYLPTDELAAFGVDESVLRGARESGVSPPSLQRALAHLISLTRARYRYAEPGIAMIDRRSRPGIRAAFELYRDILGEIEDREHHILGRRVSVPTRRRLRRALVAVATGG